MEQKKVISYVLRAAVAFAFLYPPVAALINPQGWIWFVPLWIDFFMPREIFLQLFGVAEVLIALGVLFMRNPFYPTLAAIAVLAAIIIFDWTAFDVTFRDISILLAAVALILLHRNPKKDSVNVA